MEYSPIADRTPGLSDDVLLTILPQHSQKIFAGRKLFELRKVIPRSMPRRMFLYETQDSAMITGHVVIDDVLCGSPSDVWDQTGEAATTKSSFDAYFAGRRLAYAYRIAVAVRYRNPLSREQITAIEPGFRVPQNFLYLQNVPRLRQTLQDLALSESMADASEHLKLSIITTRQRTTFRRLVKKHISGSYLETGEQYAEKLLEIAESGEDLEGFMTTGKTVCSIESGNALIGFAVFTFKLGGSVKTGPVMLLERYRNSGIGRKLRTAIHAILLRAGYRKVYATVPSTNAPALQYLLASGYELEAHLKRQYHPNHDEFVLGYMLSDVRGCAPEFIRPIAPAWTFEGVTLESTEVAGFLRDEFSAAYTPVSAEWASRQIRLATLTGQMFKPRYIFAASGGRLVAVAVCLLKRGGSLKIIVLSQTAHRESLTRFIEYCVRELGGKSGVRIRRVYTLVPAGDIEIIESFRSAGFSSEGVLKQAFNAGSDDLVLGKLL